MRELLTAEVTGRAALRLTRLEEAFCQAFVRSRHRGLAYREVYDPKEAIPDKKLNSAASSLFHNPNIQARIRELLNEAAEAVIFTASHALSAWLQIASADVNELISVKVGACRYCHGEGHGYHWREREYLEALDEYEAGQERGAKGLRMPQVGGGFGYDATQPPHPDCPDCHGEGVARTVIHDTDSLSPAARAIYGGAKVKRDGSVEILIADRIKALENACRIIGAFDDKLSLTADVRQMVAIVEKRITDPVEAAREYQKMIAANAA